MRLIIRQKAEDASVFVADYIANRIKGFNPTAERPFVLGLPTGGSPISVYQLLVDKYKAGQVCPPTSHSPLAGTIPLQSRISADRGITSW